MTADGKKEWQEMKKKWQEMHLRAQAEDPEHSPAENPFTCTDCNFERYAEVSFTPGFREDWEDILL